ncbi:uncharacterized protein LOC103718812 [Phoenix dactylifera]|uniref:Uncharacterized protein LOC103718812 n=1 Tax=Phoenix dactylifera TaxID=42345 RepID=A0A8B7CTH7_PHODC|nr:uncharacterized protein LOC103718812 [Phoenix dactylifera]
MVEPRNFPQSVKQQCWEKAGEGEGPRPRPVAPRVTRQRLPEARQLPRCLCHEYDHIIPCSKATVDRPKGNKTMISKPVIIQKSAYYRVSASNNHRMRHRSSRTLCIW